jgi:Na+/melibiose symporter-like transporter
VSLWRARDFRLLWIGETTSNLGSSVAVVALPLVAVVTLQASTFTVGLLEAVAWLPWLLIGLPAGAWVDRLAKRPIMMLCNILSMLFFASIPIAAWSGVLTVGHLLMVATCGGTAKVFFTMAYRAYLPTLVSTGDLLEANTKLQGSESAVQVAGPGLSGLLAQIFGAASGVLADAVSFGISVLCLRSVRPRETRPERTVKDRLRDEIGDGLRFVLHDPYLRVLTIFGALSNIALMGYQSVQVVFLVRDIGAEPAVVGVVLALASAGGVLGALLASRIAAAFGTARAFLLCEVLAAPALMLGPLSRPGWGLALFVAGGIGIGAGVVVSNILTATFRQSYCPPELIGRITASTAVLNYGSIPLGALLGGGVGQALGVRETLWIMAGLQVASMAILLLSPFRGLRDFPTAAARPPLRPRPPRRRLPATR